MTGRRPQSIQDVSPVGMAEVLTTFSEAETVSAAKQFAGRLLSGDVVGLYGDLGSGKTQFVKGVCLGLGIKEVVASPSFIIMNEYKGFQGGTKALSVFHFDFYRVKSLDEIYDLGIEEYFYGTGICLIEWAEAAQALLPKVHYEVAIRMLEEPNAREIRIEKIGD